MHCDSLQGVEAAVHFVDSIYHPPMKLQEGDVFTHLCQAVCSQGMASHVAITRDALGHWTSLYSPPGLVLLVLAAGDQDWRPVQTCSPQDPHQC